VRSYWPASRKPGATWIFLASFLVADVVVLWPVGLQGGRLLAVVAGTAGAAVAAMRPIRSELLWLVSGFLIGGTTVNVVFHDPFGARRIIGLLLLAALLVVEVGQASAAAGGSGRTGRSSRRLDRRREPAQ